MSDNGTKTRESKQPRFQDDDGIDSLFYVDALTDWVYRSHLVEPDLTTDARKYDDWLIDFAMSEPHLMGILSSVVSKDKNRAWQLIGGKRQVKVFGDRLRGVEDGAGWRNFVSLQSRAYYNTMIGSITEIETVTGEAGDVMESLYHVDPTKSRLLGKRETPLRYYPRKGKVQDWDRLEFFRTVSNPDIREDWRGLGICAVARCLSLAKMMIAVYEHDLEQLGAEPPKGFLVGDNVDKKMFDEAKKKRREARRNGEDSFDVDVLALFGSQTGVKTDIRFIPYSTLPTDFSLEQFTYLIILGYSLAFGYDAQEFYPVSSGSFGQNQQAALQSEKATYKGEADFSLEFQEGIQGVLPETVHYEFDRNDTRGDLAEVETNHKYMDMVNRMYETKNHQEQKISVDEYRQLAAEFGVIPVEWTENEELDMTSDTERLRYQCRWNERVVRASERFPDDPLQVLRFDPRTNLSTLRTLWVTGDDFRSYIRIHSVGSWKQPKKKEPVQTSDPILNHILNDPDCECYSCTIQTFDPVPDGFVPVDIPRRITRQDDPEEILFEDEEMGFTITVGDVEFAIEQAGIELGDESQDFQDLLTATPSNEQERILSFREIRRAIKILREFFWDTTANRYRDESGQFVSSETVRDFMRLSIEANGSISETIAAQLANGSLNTADATLLVRETLKTEYIQLGILGKGGQDQMTQQDWGHIGQMLKVQYQYLDGFMAEIAGGNLSEAQIRARLNMYYESSQQSYEAMNALTRGIKFRDLPAYPGDGSTICLSNCKCFWDYVNVFVNGVLIGYDVFWVRTFEESCINCQDRELEWNPISIRF